LRPGELVLPHEVKKKISTNSESALFRQSIQ